MVKYSYLGHFELEKYAHSGGGGGGGGEGGKGLNQMSIISSTSLITKGHGGNMVVTE